MELTVEQILEVRKFSINSSLAYYSMTWTPAPLVSDLIATANTIEQYITGNEELPSFLTAVVGELTLNDVVVSEAD